jgi:ribosome modulation factor
LGRNLHTYNRMIEPYSEQFETRAFEAGYYARKNGLHLNDNPYHEGTDQAFEWEEGWYSTQSEDEDFD